MKLSKIKKVISGTVSALMIASSIPYVASAADQQTRGNIGGYDYEMWNQNGQGQASMNPSAGSFTCSWSNIENFLARMGKNFDSQKKTYKQIGDIVLTYDVEYTPKGNSYMCVYGWTRNPLMEYYIVEGWGDWRPPGNDGENKGSVTLNGNKYDIRKSMRYNQPSLDGTATFPQYWSVRQTSGSANNQTNYMKGTIDVSKHFDAWSQAGLDMSGTLYEVSLNIEGYRSNGSANVKSVTVVTDGTGAGAGSTAEAGGNAGGGNVGGGFDMGGGGFDMSQFGGGNGGGFDMSQFGGGFDMSQFGGGNGGGFDMSQFGGMGGNGGGFDMSQFGGMGGNGGGMDWSGFAGGFNGGGANIGADAGSGGNAQSGLNAKIKGDMPTTVPSGVEKSSQCKVEKKTYMCKYTGKQKTCNVILPPNYNSSKKYPVMFVLHGIMGSENDMVSGMGVQELMTGLMSSGQAEEFIVVTPNMFTSKTMSGPSGINQQTCAEYDNFLYDVTESLLPFIKENYSVAEGRENTAITGFSMGGREAIYCGIMRPDVFGYVGGACPAPGITPGTDSFMSHPGCMTESEFKFRDVGPEPEVFMITGGTNDSVVGTFPSQYSSILTKNGVNHVYQSIPGGGHGAECVKPHLYTFMRYAFKSNEGGSTGGSTVVTTTTTKPAVVTTTTTKPAGNSKADLDAKVSKWGDANGDGSIDMGDAVAIMQALANPNKYKLSDQGKYNADVYEAGGGITTNDAATIQKYLLGLIKSLPESYSSNLNSAPATTTTKAVVTTTAKPVVTTTAAAQNNGGFDMSQFGGQGGFDMSQFGGQGGFDMSQFGGQGGFDMSQFGGQGGFDMSQFGGQQGGFDMSQFGGQQGGFDMSQFGGQQGGFDMSQFGGQGGFDMSQFGGQQGGFDAGNAGQAAGGNGGAQVQAGKKLCAISFDDGASATSKSDPAYRIIDALIKNNMTATFFIVSDWIKTNDQVKYEYQNGMEVANHTKSHPHLGQLGSSQVRSEWEQCNSKLKGIIGTEPSHLMRLPYLESNGTVQSALNDVPLISCAIDTQDWNNASKDQIVNTIKQAAQNGSLEGAIVLCHENYATTAAAMEEVLPWLAQNGYQNVNISDMAAAKGKTLAGGQVHTRV